MLLVPPAPRDSVCPVFSFWHTSLFSAGDIISVIADFREGKKSVTFLKNGRLMQKVVPARQYHKNVCECVFPVRLWVNFDYVSDQVTLLKGSEVARHIKAGKITTGS